MYFLRLVANAHSNGGIGKAEWLQRTIEFFIERDDVQFVIKTHPGELIGWGPAVYEILNEMFPDLPEHIHLLAADAKINAYDLVLAQEDFVYHAELSAEADHPHQTEPKVTHLKLVNDGLNRFSQFPWTSFERVQWVACYGDASTGASDCMAEKGFSLARTVLGTFDVMQNSIIAAKRRLCPPDIYIRPEVRGIDILEFFKAGEVYRQAETCREQLRCELARALG